VFRGSPPSSLEEGYEMVPSFGHLLSLLMQVALRTQTKAEILRYAQDDRKKMIRV
jgi:hypothetical protein